VLTGTAPLDELVPHRATMASFATDALTLPGVELVQAVFEIQVGGRQRSLPSGLHPTNPPALVLQFWNCPASPWGPFRMAQGRVECRSGLRPRGFVQGCIVDGAPAVGGLRDRWGFPAVLGTVSLRRGYDEVRATATLGGVTLAALTGVDPEPLGAHDISYTTTVSLAETPRGPRLVQIDADVVPSRAERVRPRLDAFTAEGWMHGSVEPCYAVSASVAVGDVTLQRIRYVTRPDELAFTGTEPIDGGA
jgi:hypothetical protein